MRHPAQTALQKCTSDEIEITAIANAVYHATGKRIRELPITLDKLMM